MSMPFTLRLTAAAIVCLAPAEQPPPIPRAGPLAQPRSHEQVGFPKAQTLAVIPVDNPQTPEKIALGEKLFFDGRLSADGTVACATCHDPGARLHRRPAGRRSAIHGRAGQRNAPTVLNALYNKTQFWDGRAKTLEEQAALPIVNPVEMGQPNLDAAVAAIARSRVSSRPSGSVSAGHPTARTSCAPLPPTSGRWPRSIPRSITSSPATRTRSMTPPSTAGSCSTREARCNKCHALTDTRPRRHQLHGQRLSQHRHRHHPAQRGGPGHAGREARRFGRPRRPSTAPPSRRTCPRWGASSSPRRRPTSRRSRRRTCATCW